MSHPPRASAFYHIFNASLVAVRKSWKPVDPVRILFDSPWKEGNQLFDWYSHRASCIINTIQLRKDRTPPFFHEYITFSLRGNAGCFRIDRRQRPNETFPLAAIYNEGVEAFDTIDSIRMLDDDTSDRLIEVTFCDDTQVHLIFLLKICRAIAQHQVSSVYTLQRYSCSFYSQAIILCMLQTVIAKTVKGYAGSKEHKEIVLDGDIPDLAIEHPKLPMDSPNPLHRNYPSIDFVTYEDQCSACWRLALARRAMRGSNHIVSVENLSGLFWDGVIRVTEHFINFLEIAADSQSGSWFLCPRFYWVEQCQELTYQVVKNGWDTRLRLFEHHLVHPGEILPGCACRHRESQTISRPQRQGYNSTGAGHVGHEAAIVGTNVSFPTHADLRAHYPEIARFLRTNIGDVQSEVKQKILQTCQKSKTLHSTLSNYYQAVNQKVAIQVNFNVGLPFWTKATRPLNFTSSKQTSAFLVPIELSRPLD
ncbi:unnamed protein product [Rhizoctonia solani]|uniref:Uncharacterized protein n=1 Tax=Rhizoctonia solani TaxID=456999 RepID=A0A8H3A241_9AGAM|nr:unnamed protein product [Rhizoctonia solani]